MYLLSHETGAVSDQGCAQTSLKGRIQSCIDSINANSYPEYKIKNRKQYDPANQDKTPLTMCGKQKKSLNVKRTGILKISLAVSYSHMGRPHTTIGDTPFHF